MYGRVGPRQPVSPQGLSIRVTCEDFDPSVVTDAELEAYPSGQQAILATAYTQPAVSSNVAVVLEHAADWIVAGQILGIESGGLYTVASVTDSTHVTLTNIGDALNVSPTTVVPAGGEISRVIQLAPTTFTADLGELTVTVRHPWQPGEVPVTGVWHLQPILVTADGPILPDPVRYTFPDRSK